jgi:RNA polymerase sigma factor (sigma-70 family)
MPRFDPFATPDEPRTFTTTGGVQVHVRPPRPEPEREPEPEPISTGRRAIILPEGMSDEELRGCLSSLCEEGTKIVEALLARRKDVLEESRKDLRQRVLVILCNHVAKTRTVPENVEAWLGAVVQKEVRNHKDLWRPPVQDGADAEAVPADSGREPEGTADLAERRAKLERYLAKLPAAEAAVFRCVEIFDMTLAETATATGKPPSSVYDIHRRATKMLESLVRDLREVE